MARNLEDLLPLVQELGPARMAFCTDDRDPEDIADSGHLNQMVRKAVAAGVAPEDALVLASLNPALWHGLDHLGAIAPGYQADLVVLDDLESFEPRIGAQGGPCRRGDPGGARARVGEAHGARAADLGRRLQHPVERRARAGDRPRSGSGRHGGAHRGADQSSTAMRCRIPVVTSPRSPSSSATTAPAASGSASCAASGCGSGALASTVAHDAHNVVVVGVDDNDMARAVQRLVELGGGIVAVESRGVRAELPLPVAGLLSDAPLADVVAQSRACNEAAAALGCKVATPFLTLSFLALSVIPKLKITDHGLVDVDRFEIVPLAVE